MIYSEITAFGTPGETRTHYLALRRRTLYPGELRGPIWYCAIVTENLECVNKIWEIFYAQMHILSGRPYDRRWDLCTKIMKRKGRIWMIGSSPVRSISPASGDESGRLPGIFLFWSFFHFLLYRYACFGYNKPKCAKIKGNERSNPWTLNLTAISKSWTI